jgi:hypothetical protein
LLITGWVPLRHYWSAHAVILNPQPDLSSPSPSPRGAGDYWFCALSAYLTIAACIALCIAVVCISYTVLRVLQGNPVPEKTVMSWGLAGWIIGFLLATIFSGNGLLGPYKNLYCLVDQGLYRGYGTAPVLITVFGCFSLMVNNYVLAFSIVREAERRYEAESDFAYANKASRVVLRNGITVIGTFYISWFLIFLNAFITAAGGTVPVEVRQGSASGHVEGVAGRGQEADACFGVCGTLQMDVVASLLSKFQPIADSLVLHQMLHKIAARYLVKKVADNTADVKRDNNVLRRAVSSDRHTDRHTHTDRQTDRQTGHILYIINT